MAKPDVRGRLERRNVPGTVECRAEGSKPAIGGYAAVFNKETVIGSWFRERIAPGAFDDAIKTDDVRALFNHDPNYVIGRNTNGTLTLGADKTGLRYDVDLNMDDPDAQRVYAKVKRGDVDGSSFGFMVERDEDEEWDFSETKKGKLPLRTIVRASLFDVSPVTYPAYPSASVSARAMDLSETDAAEMVAKAEARVRQLSDQRLADAEAALAERKAWDAA